MEKNIIAQWFVENMELHFCLSKWKTESIVCALIYPNAHLSEKIEFLPCINNSTHCATHCKPKIRPFAVTGCELTDVWFAYSLQLLSLLLLCATVAVSAADCFNATATAAVVASSTAVINAKKPRFELKYRVCYGNVYDSFNCECNM